MRKDVIWIMLNINLNAISNYYLCNFIKMKKKILCNNTYPYKRYEIDPKGNDKYIFTEYMLVNSCWRINLRKKTNRAGVDKLLCTANRNILSKILLV